MKSVHFLFSLFLLYVMTASLFASVEKMECPMHRDYYLYLPQQIDPEKTYWLVCYVHGANGSGSTYIPSLSSFVERGDCIGVAPSFATGFQLLQNGTDDQLIGILHQLSEKYRLHTKLFIYGHSAGGQFAHRFTLRHPDLVIGCEACSSGTWATGGIYQSLTSAAQTVPMAIACGEDDTQKIGTVIARLAHDFSETQKAVFCNDDPGWSRIEWFYHFSQMLQQEHYFFKAKSFPNELHHVQEDEQTDLAMESFLLATSGMLPQERATYDAAIATIKKNRAEGKSDLVESGLQQLQQRSRERSKEIFRISLLSQGWQLNEATLDRCLKSQEEFVKEEMALIQKR